jgi:monoamine oxidase
MHSDNSLVPGGYWDSGQVSEFCGELIDSNHETILSLAKRFELETHDLLSAEPDGSTETYFLLGQHYPAEQADIDFRAVHRAVTADIQAAPFPTTYRTTNPAAISLDKMSVYDWIESRVPGGHSSPLGMLLDVAYTEEYGAETTDQSALNIVYLLGFQPGPDKFSIYGSSDERYHIAVGNQRLPEAIAESLTAGSINMGWRMESIWSNTDGSVGMSFDTGDQVSQTVTADRVILCMSFSVLRTLDYSRAAFDDLKQAAITQLGSGRNTKLQLQFASRYWNQPGRYGISTGDVYTDLDFQNTWEVTRAQPGATGILVDFTGGAAAASFAPSTPYSNATTEPLVTTYAKAFLASLEKLYPGIGSEWNGKATLSTPFRDLNLGCSSSYCRVGQYAAFKGYEGTPQGNIHFAGEHCSLNFQGFMEGAGTEGIRAANEILASLV